MTTGWPGSEQERSELLSAVERTLMVGGEALAFSSLEPSDGAALAARAPLPPALRTVLHLYERCGAATSPTDLDRTLSVAAATELWARFTERARVLAAAGSIPAECPEPPLRLSARQLLQRILRVVTTGARPPRPAGPGLLARGLALLDGLALHVEDLRSAGSRAARALVPQPPLGVCRHHATMVQTLFVAARRATGAAEGARLLVVSGFPDFSSHVAHAWNWYVEEDVAWMAAVDLTTAQTAVWKKRSATIFGQYLDGSDANNLSCFLDCLFYCFASSGFPLYRHQAVPAALRLLVDGETARGQALLFRLAQQVRLAPQARARIESFLANRGFDGLFTGWREALRRPRPGALAYTDRLWSAAATAHQLDLLAALEI